MTDPHFMPSHVPGQTVAANVAGGAAKLLQSPPGLSPKSDPGIMPPMVRDLARRIQEVMRMPAPARLIALPQPPARVRPSADWPLADYLEWWLQFGAPDLAPSSRETYRHVARRILDNLGTVPIGQLRTADIQTVIGGMLADGLSEATVYLARCGLSSALSAAVRFDALAVNPCRGVRSPIPSAPDRTVLTRGQTDALIATLASADPWPPVNAVLTLMLTTGVRVGEAIAPLIENIRLSPPYALHVEWQGSKIRGQPWVRRRPKTKRSRRTITLAPVTIAAIERRLALHPRLPSNDDWPLGATLARPFGKSAVSMALRSACKDAGVPIITPHECRTTFATNAHAAGVKDATLEYILGDTYAVIRRHYLKVHEGAAAEAIAMMFAPG